MADPIPAGLGVVDIVLITALAAAGLPATRAVTAVLVYRIITFKILFTVGFTRDAKSALVCLRIAAAVPRQPMSAPGL